MKKISKHQHDDFFTSCAAGLSICLVLVVLLYVILALTAIIGRRDLTPVLTVHTSSISRRALARHLIAIVILLAPSAALVLY